MFRILLAFIILLGAVYLGVQLNYDMGYVFIRINHWTVETTLWVGVLIIAILFLVLLFLIQCIHKLARTPSAIHQWHTKHLVQKAQSLTRKGLIEYSEGYWMKAKNHLIAALPYTDMPLINYLTAARAAQKMGNSQLRDHYLREAQQSMPDAKIAVELTQAQLQLANHQWEQAIATLKHLQVLAPHHPYVLKLLMQLYVEIKDWFQLIDLLPLLKKNKVISVEAYAELEEKTYLQALKELIKQNHMQTVKVFFNGLPKALATNPQLVAEYSAYLIQETDYETAEVLLQRSFRRDYSPNLIAVYSALPANDKQLHFAEALLKKNPHCGQLHLYLGKLCMHLHLWGKAKVYLEDALKLSPSALAYLELGRLYEQLNDVTSACINYKKGLALLTEQGFAKAKTF